MRRCTIFSIIQRYMWFIQRRGISILYVPNIRCMWERRIIFVVEQCSIWGKIPKRELIGRNFKKICRATLVLCGSMSLAIRISTNLWLWTWRTGWCIIFLALTQSRIWTIVVPMRKATTIRRMNSTRFSRTSGWNWTDRIRNYFRLRRLFAILHFLKHRLFTNWVMIR